MSSKEPKVEGVMSCPDGHRCENGSICVENEYDEGNYYCDCDSAFLNSAYQGLYCEHEATTYCSYQEAVSRKSFCTNGGTCIAKVGEGEAHMGCKCPAEYEGEHCQFVKGTKPEGWPYTNKKAKTPNEASGGGGGGGGGGLSGGAIFGIVAVVVALVLLAALFLRKSMVQSKEQQPIVESDSASPKGPVTEHNLDADGGKLKESLETTPESGDFQIGNAEEGLMEEDSEII